MLACSLVFLRSTSLSSCIGGRSCHWSRFCAASRTASPWRDCYAAWYSTHKLLGWREMFPSMKNPFENNEIVLEPPTVILPPDICAIYYTPPSPSNVLVVWAMKRWSKTCNRYCWPFNIGTMMNETIHKWVVFLNIIRLPIMPPSIWQDNCFPLKCLPVEKRVGSTCWRPNPFFARVTWSISVWIFRMAFRNLLWCGHLGVAVAHSICTRPRNSTTRHSSLGFVGVRRGSQFHARTVWIDQGTNTVCTTTTGPVSNCHDGTHLGFVGCRGWQWRGIGFWWGRNIVAMYTEYQVPKVLLDIAQSRDIFVNKQWNGILVRKGQPMG